MAAMSTDSPKVREYETFKNHGGKPERSGLPPLRNFAAEKPTPSPEKESGAAAETFLDPAGKAEPVRPAREQFM